ncbi:MAG: hypothetical protein AB7I38_18795 [Dehalococcoidia bacterium]
MTAKRPKTVAEGWVPQRHGIPSSYNRGCRCDECRSANAVRHQAAIHSYKGANQRRNYAKRTFVAGRWIAPLPDEKHGKVGTYTRHGCRCISCTRAYREHQAAYRARRSAS